MALPEPSEKRGSNSKPSGRGLPEPGGDFGDFSDFLKAEHIGKLGTTATLLISGPPEARETEFSDVQLPVKHKGKEYSYGLKSEKPSYARLHARFSANPKKWVGKKFDVEIKMFKKKLYVAVV